MKVVDHSKCADGSKINVMDKHENLLHDLSNNVLVCISSQQVLLQSEFADHAQACEKCHNVNPDALPNDLSTGLALTRKVAVQGIAVQQDDAGIDYQIIDGKTR